MVRRHVLRLPHLSRQGVGRSVTCFSPRSSMTENGDAMRGRRMFLRFVVLLAVTTGCAQQQQGADPAQLEPWFRRYVDLLNAGDRDALARHLDAEAQPPSTDAADDAKARLAKYGQQHLVVQKVVATKTFPQTYQVTVTVRTPSEQTTALDEIIRWVPEKNRWFLNELNPKDRPVPTGAASTQRPSP